MMSFHFTVSVKTRNTHQFDVSLSIQHEILRFQVSVEDALAMEVIERLCDTTDTEFGSGLIKTSPEDKKAQFKRFADKWGQILRCQRGRGAAAVVALHNCTEKTPTCRQLSLSD